MASETQASIALLFAVNLLLLLATASACGYCPNPPNHKPSPNPNPKPTPSPETATCPRDALKLGVCADVLNGLLHVNLGTPPVAPCCTLIQGLADLEAAACLCTALKADILGINLDIPVSLTLLLNVCSINVPRGFQCA